MEENEKHFQENITQALAIKLNDCIDDVKKSVSKKLLEKKIVTNSSSQLNEFISFIEEFKEGKFLFQDGSSINITENEMKIIKMLFESLNAENREKMICDIFKSSNEFKQHLKFANDSKGLI
jgi:hypothetical protein